MHGQQNIKKKKKFTRIECGVIDLASSLTKRTAPDIYIQPLPCYVDCTA